MLSSNFLKDEFYNALEYKWYYRSSYAQYGLCNFPTLHQFCPLRPSFLIVACVGLGPMLLGYSSIPNIPEDTTRGEPRFLASFWDHTFPIVCHYCNNKVILPLIIQIAPLSLIKNLFFRLWKITTVSWSTLLKILMKILTNFRGTRRTQLSSQLWDVSSSSPLTLSHRNRLSSIHTCCGILALQSW